MAFADAESPAERLARLQEAVNDALGTAAEHDSNAEHIVGGLCGDGAGIGEGLLALAAAVRALVYAVERQTAVMESQPGPRR